MENAENQENNDQGVREESGRESAAPTVREDQADAAGVGGELPGLSEEAEAGPGGSGGGSEESVLFDESAGGEGPVVDGSVSGDATDPVDNGVGVDSPEGEVSPALELDPGVERQALINVMRARYIDRALKIPPVGQQDVDLTPADNEPKVRLMALPDGTPLEVATSAILNARREDLKGPVSHAIREMCKIYNSTKRTDANMPQTVFADRYITVAMQTVYMLWDQAHKNFHLAEHQQRAEKQPADFRVDVSTIAKLFMERPDAAEKRGYLRQALRIGADETIAMWRILMYLDARLATEDNATPVSGLVAKSLNL